MEILKANKILLHLKSSKWHNIPIYLVWIQALLHVFLEVHYYSQDTENLDYSNRDFFQKNVSLSVVESMQLFLFCCLFHWYVCPAYIKTTVNINIKPIKELTTILCWPVVHRQVDSGMLFSISQVLYLWISKITNTSDLVKNLFNS